MNHIINWHLFSEGTTNTKDSVDLFKITSLIEPSRPISVYSVMRGKNEKSCINFHISQILNRLRAGSSPEPLSDYEPEADELYFYGYVIEWLNGENRLGSLNKDELAEKFLVEKINDEKITRLEANDLKKQALKSDPNIFRAAELSDDHVMPVKKEGRIKRFY